jgi:site-specific recombinase XerD
MEHTLHTAPLPANPHDIALYVTHLGSKLKTSTIRSHLSAVAFFHQIHGFENPTSSFLIKKLLAGHRRRERHTPGRKPVTIKLLGQLLSALRSGNFSPFQRKLFRAIFTLMYHAALRASEICVTPNACHALTASDIAVIPCKQGEALKISFKTYKHSPKQPKPMIIYPTHSQTCAVRAYKLYARPQAQRDGPAFLTTLGRPLTRQLISSVLRDLLTSLHIKASAYNTHSFRIGKATDMATQGYSHAQIALLGRWKSNAFLQYIRPTVIHGTR